ncbi:MAG: DUF2768 family protein [Paenibacillaceae bacterium]
MRRRLALYFFVNKVCAIMRAELNGWENITMSSMDKMWASLIAIALMLVASVLITFARSKTKGIIRVVLTIVAFLLLILIVFLMLLSMF